MSATNDGGSAFPMFFGLNDEANAIGMSLRDYFAAAALNGLLAKHAFTCEDSVAPSPREAADFAEAAYTYANAMLNERAK